MTKAERMAFAHYHYMRILLLYNYGFYAESYINPLTGFRRIAVSGGEAEFPTSDAIYERDHSKKISDLYDIIKG